MSLGLLLSTTGCGLVLVLFFGLHTIVTGIRRRSLRLLPSESPQPTLNQLWPADGDLSNNNAKVEYGSGGGSV